MQLLRQGDRAAGDSPVPSGLTRSQASARPLRVSPCLCATALTENQLWVRSPAAPTAVLPLQRAHSPPWHSAPAQGVTAAQTSPARWHRGARPLPGLQPGQCPPKWHSQTPGSLGGRGSQRSSGFLINNQMPGLFSQLQQIKLGYPKLFLLPEGRLQNKLHSHLPPPFPTINTSREDGNRSAVPVQQPEAKQARNPGSCPQQDVSQQCHWHRK